ncbi:MAG: O-antigen ligase family protein [Lautropia sp.]
MDQLVTAVPWLIASVVVLAAIVFGLGFALHFQTRMPQLALPLIGLVMTVVPPVGIVMVGRNLSLKNLDFYQQVDPGGVAAWVLRGSTAAMIALALSIILVQLLDRSERSPSGRALFFGFMAFFLTNTGLNAAFGTLPGITAQHFYSLLLFAAIFLVRERGYASFLTAIKWGLLFLMVGSFVFIPLQPALVMQTNTPEIRLPFVSFRFWGIGSGPNSIGPIALVQILLTLHIPFRSRLVQWLSLLSSAGVLLLAQSQTSWMCAAVILPPFVVYRWLTDETKGAGRRFSPLLAGGALLIGAAFALAGASFFVDWLEVWDTLASFAGLGNDGLSNKSLSGRGAIWVVALDTFRENPLFGYGLTAWDTTFRAKINMPFAFHAHNQLMHSLSVGGLLGALGFIVYFGTLAYFSIKLARFTRGLAPAILVLMTIRSITEVPFELGTVLVSDFVTQISLFSLLAGSLGLIAAKARAPARTRSLRAAVLDRPEAAAWIGAAAGSRPVATAGAWTGAAAATATAASPGAAGGWADTPTRVTATVAPHADAPARGTASAEPEDPPMPAVFRSRGRTPPSFDERIEPRLE